MKRLYVFVLMLMMLSCKEDIAPVVQPNKPDQNPDTGGNNGGGNGGGNSGDCTLKPFTPVTGKYANCLPLLDNTTFDIVTWNIENFPKSSTTTVNTIKDIISTLNPDVIAFEEIGSVTTFTQMISSIGGWSSVVMGKGSQRVGYAYKQAEVTFSDTKEIFTSDTDAFPRAPLVTTASHVSGIQITLIALHLKCCDDGTSIPRRKDASNKLKSYIDTNLPNAAVVMLGDMNEDITQPEGNGVFTNFIEDAANYKFADMQIATCSSANWSFPSWPSHLDHMLITNELFDKVSDIRTLKIIGCESSYHNVVSDHFPVLMSLK